MRLTWGPGFFVALSILAAPAISTAASPTPKAISTPTPTPETSGSGAIAPPKPTPPSSVTPAPVSAKIEEEETIIPTFETQKLARTYIFDVTAPRGQITDRRGAPLAQRS